jgi:hypothetical protein
VKLARRFNPQVAATLEGYSDEEVWSRIAVMRRSDDQEDVISDEGPGKSGRRRRNRAKKSEKNGAISARLNRAT